MASEGDEFQRANMEAGAQVLHTDKKVSRGLSLVLLLPAFFLWFMAAYIPWANPTASKPLPPGAVPIVAAGIAMLGLVFLLMSLVFGVLRTVVTSREVNVKYGLWGPVVPLAAIRTVRAMEYDWTQFGGWGIRRGVGGTWAYVPSTGRVVEIAWLEGGAERKVVVGAGNADELVRQIEKARSALPRVRVDEASGASEGEEASASERSKRGSA